MEQEGRIEEIEVSGDEARELAAFRRAIESGEIEAEVDTTETARRIASELMDAPDLESALEGKPVWSARDSVGMQLELRGLRLNLSSYTEGSPVYAVVDAVDLVTGEVGVLTTGATKHLAALYIMQRDHRWPVTVRITQALRPTSGGFYPLGFELVEAERAEA